MIYFPPLTPSTMKGIIENHYPTWPENLEDWEVRGAPECQPWPDTVEKYVLFLVSQVYLKWFKVGIQASEISKLKNPSETRQKTHLDADRFNVMPRIEMTDLESLWTQKNRIWQHVNAGNQSGIQHVSRGYQGLVLDDFIWFMIFMMYSWPNWMEFCCCRWCRILQSTSFHSMKWHVEKAWGHLGTWCHIYLFAILCL